MQRYYALKVRWLVAATLVSVSLAAINGTAAQSPTATETSTTLTDTTSTVSTTTASTTTITITTSTRTTTTVTTTSSTQTSTTSSTSTSTTGPHVFGSNITQQTFMGWLSVWRAKYELGIWHAGLDDPWESRMPEALKGIPTKVVVSEGGVAGGIVTEGMGYGIMVEGFLAYKGDEKALQNGLSLTKSWLAMVNGPADFEHPLGGGRNASKSAAQVDTWPYGVSAVEWSQLKLGPAGVAAWKFPINVSDPTFVGNLGSATDADGDALLGMVYLAAAMDYPADFADIVVRGIISFASADLGFPDMYRELPDGAIMYVVKAGSQWGGLTPNKGKYGTSQEPWCYNPGYFAPAHYRTFRDFLLKNWQAEYNEYLPAMQDGSPTTLTLLLAALDSAVTSGYNLLFYSSCQSGSVANWVGVKAECEDASALNCAGVPWKHTPWVGTEGGTCEQSGTEFGSWGADASRTTWRIAMDYALYREESSRVQMYDRDGHPDDSIVFGARTYLNRVVVQYASRAICDGGEPGNCMKYTTSPYEFAYAYDTTTKFNATGVTCDAVPNAPESWWAGFMAYPTFAAFIAPYDEIGAAQMTQWMDTFSSICNFTGVNLTDFKAGSKPLGDICLTTYFDSSQAVIATMIMSDMLIPLAAGLAPDDRVGSSVIMEDQQSRVVSEHWILASTTARGSLMLVATVALAAAARSWWRCSRVPYSRIPLAAPMTADGSLSESA